MPLNLFNKIKKQFNVLILAAAASDESVIVTRWYRVCFEFFQLPFNTI
jgi:hypothetical protein